MFGVKVLLGFGLLTSVWHYGESLSCYVSAPGGFETIRPCSPYTKGCLKLILYTPSERVSKSCGAEEQFGLQFREGCDTVSVPFKQKQCYCRGQLCNGARKEMEPQMLVFTASLVSVIVFTLPVE